MQKVIVILLVIIGTFLFFADDLINFSKKIYSNRYNLLSYLINLPKKLKKKKTLKDYINDFEKEKGKDNFIKSSYKLIDDVFKETDHSVSKNKIKRYKKICFLSGTCGFLIATFLKSPLLIPVMSLGLGLLPMWLLRFKRYKYTLKLTDELSVALSTISSSYIRSGKIIHAVEENLCYLKYPVKQSFEKFIQNCNINPNIKGNLASLRDEIDNKIFKLWCDNLIASQDDFNQASSLNAVVEQFSTEKSIYNELKTELQQPIIYYMATLLLTLIAFPISIYLGNSFEMENMSNLFLETFTGQVLLTAFAIAAFWGVNKAIKLSTSLDEID